MLGMLQDHFRIWVSLQTKRKCNVFLLRGLLISFLRIVDELIHGEWETSQLSEHWNGHVKSIWISPARQWHLWPILIAPSTERLSGLYQRTPMKYPQWCCPTCWVFLAHWNVFHGDINQIWPHSMKEVFPSEESWTRGHRFKGQGRLCRTEMRRGFVIQRVVNLWTSLQSLIVYKIVINRFLNVKGIERRGDWAGK